ncbi:hypothetical protein Tco_1511411, partial [Tanacetum coccineum]
SPETATDLEGCSKDSFEPYVPREAGLGVDFEDDSSEPFRSRRTDLEMDVDVERSDEIEIDPEVQAEIDECFAYAYALRDRGIDARVEGAVEVTYETLGDLVQRFHDHTREIPVHRIQVIESVQKDQGHRIIAMGQHSADMLERIREMERDNKSLRETREGVNKQSDHQLAEALRVRDAIRNLGPLIGDEDEQEVPATKWKWRKWKCWKWKCNCPEKYQVKYALCTLLNSTLTWGNSHKRTISSLGHELGKTYEVDDRSVLSKKQGPEDGDRVVELGYERK